MVESNRRHHGWSGTCAVGVLSGGGAIASLAAAPISAPVTGLLAACAGGAFTMSAGAFGSALDGTGRMSDTTS